MNSALRAVRILANALRRLVFESRWARLGGDRVVLSNDLKDTLLRSGRIEPYRRTYAKRQPKVDHSAGHATAGRASQPGAIAGRVGPHRGFRVKSHVLGTKKGRAGSQQPAPRPPRLRQKHPKNVILHAPCALPEALMRCAPSDGLPRSRRRQCVVPIHNDEHDAALIDALGRYGDGLPAQVLLLAVNEVTRLAPKLSPRSPMAHRPCGYCCARPRHDNAPTPVSVHKRSRALASEGRMVLPTPLI